MTLKPLELVFNKVYGEHDGWKVIGYPIQSKPDMHELDGSYLPNYTVIDGNNFGTMTIMMHGAADRGMSGGPWILPNSDNKVNGIQSCAPTVDTTRGRMEISITPYFNRQMLSQLDLIPDPK